MFKLPIEKIVNKIHESKPEISKEEINSQIDAKVEQLSGLISREGAAHIIANEHHVKLFQAVEGQLKIKDIVPGMRSLETVGKVIRIFEVREFQSEKGSGKVASMIIGDETGTIRVTFWHAQTDILSTLNEGNIVKILNAYSKDNRGNIEIQTNDRTEVKINPEGVEVGEVSESIAKRKKIADLVEGESGVELLATIVQIMEPRFYEICPQCRKRAQASETGFKCLEHNEITPDYGYVLNLVLDDGSETIRAAVFNQQVLELTGKDSQSFLVCKDSILDFDSIKHDLLGKIVKTEGRVQKNSMFDRLEINLNKIDPNPDPTSEIESK